MALTGQKRLAAVLAVLLTTAGMGTALDRLAAHRAAPPGDIPRRLALAEPDPTKRKPEFPGATLDLKADAVVPAGVPVVVTVTLTNTDALPLRYWCGGPGRYPGLHSTLAEVTGADGRPSEAPLTNGQHVMGSGTNEQVAPGQSISFPALLHATPRAGTYTLRVGKGKPARVTVKDDAKLLREWEQDLLAKVRQGEPFAQHVAREYLSPWLQQALFQDLVSDDARHALQAAWTLVMLQQFPPGTDARLRKVMKHHLQRRKAGQPDDGVLYCLAIMASRFESDDALDTVLDLVHSESPGDTRAHAVRHLRSFTQAKAVRALHALLNDANQSVRQTAAQVLGERKDPAALPPLLAVAADPQNQHRASALRALLHFPDDPRVEPALRRGLEDADEGVRSDARRLLDELAQKRKRD